MECEPNDIENLDIINAGFTNILFKFTVFGTDYVYRHPGGSDKFYSKRSNERYAQTQAKEYDIDKSLIYMDPTGWKIAYFIEDIIEFDIENPNHRKQLFDAIHRTHEIPVTDEIGEFDNVIESKKLLTLASQSRGNLFEQFKELFAKIDKVHEYVLQEREKYGIS